MAHVQTSVYLKPEVIRGGSASASCTIRTNPAKFQAITTSDHEEVTLWLNWLPWITGIATYSFDTTTAGGAGFTAHYRYSTDGGQTWSGEASISNITTHTFTAERLHLRLIFKRTGPPSGTFIINGFTLTASVNASNHPPTPELWPHSVVNPIGAQGWTYAWDKNPTARVKEIMQGISAGMPETFGTPAKRYGFYYGRPDNCTADYTKPVIFLYDCRMLTEADRIRETRLIQFRIGVKRRAQSVRHPNEEEVYGVFQNQIQMLFGPSWGRFEIDAIEVNGCWFYGCTLADFGVKDCRTFGSAFRYSDPSLKDNCGAPESWETVIEFTLRPFTPWNGNLIL
jgi:hypothetical protein